MSLNEGGRGSPLGSDGTVLYVACMNGGGMRDLIKAIFTSDFYVA